MSAANVVSTYSQFTSLRARTGEPGWLFGLASAHPATPTDRNSDETKKRSFPGSLSTLPKANAVKEQEGHPTPITPSPAPSEVGLTTATPVVEAAAVTAPCSATCVRSAGFDGYRYVSVVTPQACVPAGCTATSVLRASFAAHARPPTLNGAPRSYW